LELADEELGHPELRAAFRVVRAAAAAELVVVDDGPTVGEIDEREEVVVCSARPAVEHDERRGRVRVARAQIARGAVPRHRIVAAERERNGALAYVHDAASLRSPGEARTAAAHRARRACAHLRRL